MTNVSSGPISAWYALPVSSSSKVHTTACHLRLLVFEHSSPASFRLEVFVGESKTICGAWFRRLQHVTAERSVQALQVKNRESAARSRQRKAQYTNDLENQIAELQEQNRALRMRILQLCPDDPAAIDTSAMDAMDV